MDENLIGIDAFPGRFRDLLHGFHEIAGHGRDIREIELQRLDRPGLIERVNRVADQGGLEEQTGEELPGFFFCSALVDFAGGGAEEGPVFTFLIDPDAGVRDIPDAVLVKGMADEIEFPAFGAGFCEFPGIRAGGSEERKQIRRHMKTSK